MKPRLLLHICCAPDEAWVVHSLNQDFELHCFFCNPNIKPAEEYHKRLAEARRVAQIYGVAFDADEYVPRLWEEAVSGLEHTPEGGLRCEQCFLLRLRQTARFCRSIGWSHFTTVMSISPHKKISMLNETGKVAAKEYGVIYEPYNFKKKDGFLNSIKHSKALGLYRQDYCGCPLSKAERERRQKSSP
ncbi:MAG: epoxyqueuosine reductase QueH [Fibrobacterota bacterium]